MRSALIVVPFVCFTFACEDKPSAAPAAPSSSAATAASSAAPSATASAAPKPTMAEMQMASLKLLTESYGAHDAHLAATAYAADGVLKVIGLGELKGREQIESYTKRDITGFPDAKVGIVRTWQKGNVSVVEWVYAGTNTGDFMGQKATGRPAGVNGVSVSVFTDEGLIKEERRYFDMMTVSSQLDAKAKAGTFRSVAAPPTAAVEKHVAKDDDATLAKINAMYAAGNTHKIDDLLGFVTDDTQFDDYSQAASFKGKKGFKDAWTMYLTAFPDAKQTNTMQLVADGWVVSEGVLEGTNKGALGPIKASNKPVSIHYVDIWQVKDSKIVAGRTYANGMEIMVQVGAMPAPGAAPSGSAAASAAPSASAPKK